MPTLVLSQRYTTDSSTLWRAAIAEGWNVERVLGYRCTEGVADPVLYGETLFADAVSEQLGIVLLQPTADWLPRLPERYRRRSVKLETLGAALACGETNFVKPPDDKVFRAGLYDGSQLANVTTGLAPELEVLVSEPVSFDVEYRSFVLERQCQTLSLYLRGGDLPDSFEVPESEMAGAQEFIDAVLADPDVALPPAVVLDVGRLEDGRWAVVEANPAWGSGLLACEPLAVLRTIRRASLAAAALTADDKLWVRTMTRG